MYLDGEIEKIEYEQHKAEMEQEKEQLLEENEKVQVVGDDIQQMVDKVITVASQLPKLMNKATPAQKRELFNLILTDCTISGQKLSYNLRKPFDKFLISNRPSDWKNISVDDFHDIDGIKYSVEKISERLI